MTEHHPPRPVIGAFVAVSFVAVTIAFAAFVVYMVT